MGGDIVPAVTGVVVSVVMVMSRIVDVLWTGSCRVGVIIVLWRLLWMRKLWVSVVSLSMLMLRSPWIVIEVCGDVV